MTRGYFPGEATGWAILIEQAQHPLDPACAVCDLRWWADQCRLPRNQPPTISILAERWGWSRSKVQRFIRAGLDEHGVPDWAAAGHEADALALLEDYGRRDPRRRGAAR